VDLGTGGTNGNIYVKGGHILHSDTDSLGDWSTLSNVFRGTLTSFNDDLTVGNVIANSNPSGNTGVFFGDFSAWPASNPTGNLSYYGVNYTRSGSPAVGTDFYRNKVVLQGNADVDGMVIKPKVGDPESKLWWEINGGSVMLLRGTTAAYGQTGYLGLGLNNDGTELPSVHLQVGGTAYTGTFKFVDGNQQAGYVMTSDGDGNVSWAPVSGSTGGGGTTGTTCCVDAYNDLGDVMTTMSWNVSGTSTNYEATMTGNTTLNITNVRNGDYGTMILHQDGVGNRTLTLGTVNGGAGTHKVVNGGAGVIKLTANANATDIISFTYNGSILYWTPGNDYT
jgi:hypothetical protein